ncbi:cellulose binding domain-containing protein, partial [Actinacidiphila oryziradicis]|uniref:cellulose binding domain-containing protein n=1 Tax=Actinacidiphila oryziradicis TaxID=2571141 RepID=UPI0023F23C65
QRVTQMWNGEFTQSGSRVTVTQASYNAAVAGGQPISFGFLGTWSKNNSAPSTFSLGSSSCDG